MTEGYRGDRTIQGKTRGDGETDCYRGRQRIHRGRLRDTEG